MHLSKKRGRTALGIDEGNEISVMAVTINRGSLSARTETYNPSPMVVVEPNIKLRLVVMLTLAALLVSLMPLLAVTYPPLHDFPFHLARIQILTHLQNGTVLQEYYRVGSFILPNVAMDIVMYALAAALPIAIAGQLFIAMIFVLLVTGTMALHRVLHGRFSVWPILSAVCLYNWIFLFGFVNYLFGLGLMLWGFAAWIMIEPRRELLRLVAGSIIALLLFFSHLAALGVYAVAVAAFELQSVLGRPQAWSRNLRRLAIGALPFALPLGLLLLASPTGDMIGAGVAFNFWPGWKPLALYRTLLSGNALLDATTPIVLGSVLVAILCAGRIRIARPMRLAIVAISLTFLVAPTNLMGALLLDARLPIAIVFIAIASTAVGFRNASVGRVVAVAIAGLLLFRAVALTVSWAGYERIQNEFIDAFVKIPAGSAMFVGTGGPLPSLLFTHDEELEFWRPPLKHIVSLATVVKPIFVPATWADPTQQPITVAPRYSPMKALQGNNPFSPAIVSSDDLARLIVKIHEAQHNAGDNHDAYLLLLYPDRALEWPQQAVPVASGSRFVLFNVGGPS